MLRLWPRLHREPGPFVWSGNCVPELALRMGRAFRLELQTESASRNPRLEWDTLSGTALNRKLRPGIDAQNGMRFPNRLQAEIASHSESSFWDTLFARSFVGKPCPILSTQSGTWFPRVLPTGKRVPVWQADGHKLSSSYNSTSLSHAGRAVCRMPAVCSFLASIPAERTSFMVKRSRG